MGNEFQVQDWYTPQNQQVLKRDDVDLGSAGPVMIPDSHLLVAAGKEGRMYLIDRNDMGKGVKLSLHSFQVTNGPIPRVGGAPDHIYWNIHGSPVIYSRPERSDRRHRFSSTSAARKTGSSNTGSSPTGAAGWKFEADIPFAMSRESALSPTSRVAISTTATASRSGCRAASFSLMRRRQGRDGRHLGLHAAGRGREPPGRPGHRPRLRAANVARPELWDSEMNPGDGLGMFAKFCPPTVANGKVYVAGPSRRRSSWETTISRSTSRSSAGIDRRWRSTA